MPGRSFLSRQEYKATMLQSSSYGGTAEVKAAGFLYPARFEVYERNTGILRAKFGREGYAIKRLLFSGNLSSGHYDFCSPIGSEELLNNTYDNTQESLVNKTQDSKVGRPRRNKGGRPKKSKKTRSEQVLEAKQKYKQTHPKINRPAVAYRTATDLEESQGQHLQVNTELVIPDTSVYSMTYTPKSPTPISMTYTPKHSASLVADKSGDTLSQKILSIPRKRKSSEDLKKYNKEKKRESRNKEDVKIKERIRNRLSKRLQRSQESTRKRDNVRARNMLAHGVLREDPVYRENEQARNTAAHRVTREPCIQRK
ncbi:hypothetical protein EVAR_96355_1 [Eumeta japonica]|uniref:Uncharacterized protein n=1 Tax=Eumeta variegata TaxID=151549 RepID=A0A4C1VWE0_EUMVA|nr:hypothetical protein EVAR_96355_1 [Eumeta japonica]